MMKAILLIFLFTLTCFYSLVPVHAQLDPAAMATLSNLSPDQRQQLIKQYQSSGAGVSKSAPTATMPTRSIQVVEPEDESFDDRSDFLGDLTRMERMVSADLARLQIQVQSENSTGDNELLEAFAETKSLLNKIKDLQRREIEKRAEEFGKSEDDAVKPFGYDLFASDPSTFAPGNEVPIPSDYRIGPGDLVEIQLFGQRNDSFSLGISRDGMLRFPGIGPINAFEKGTQFIDLKNHLREKIREHLGEGVQSSITMGAFRSIRIFMLGEVRKQGAYTVSSLSTTINALLSCGGIKETGSLRNIQLKRAGKVISVLDLYDLLMKGDTSADQPLQPGDVIFVPVVKNQVTVSGAVRRSAKYEISTEETLSDALDLAGGAINRATIDFIRLERLDHDLHPIVKNLDLSKDAKFRIKHGDLISIGYVGSTIKNVVSIVGAVEKVGDFEWKKNLFLNDLIDDASLLLPNTDLAYGLIRRIKENGKIHCITFVPNELFDLELTKKIELKSRDIVYFFPRNSRNPLLSGLLADLRKQGSSDEKVKIVKINGSVHYPGSYPFTDSMTLVDLFRAAGGVKDSAYMLDAEVTRMIIDKEQHATIKHFRLSSKQLSQAVSSLGFSLQPYDVVSIKLLPYWNDGEGIKVLGEIKFPGFYPISPGETLFDILQRAGGLTNRAFPEGVIFSRENLRLKEDEQRERLIAQLESDLATATLASKDSEEAAQAQSAARAMLSRLQNTESQGRLVIALSEIIKAGDQSNLMVKDGDQLFIPEIPYAVSVSGEVQFPTSHLHEENLSMKDYLNRSGGYTQNADKDRTFVVKANGAVMTKGGNAWFGKDSASNHISPGDVIVVPIDVKQTRFLENLTYSTQIIYQLAVAAAAVNSF